MIVAHGFSWYLLPGYGYQTWRMTTIQWQRSSTVVLAPDWRIFRGWSWRECVVILLQSRPGQVQFDRKKQILHLAQPKLLTNVVFTFFSFRLVSSHFWVFILFSTQNTNIYCIKHTGIIFTEGTAFVAINRKQYSKMKYKHNYMDESRKHSIHLIHF